MTLETQSLKLLDEALKRLETSFDDMPDFDLPVDMDAMGAVLNTVADRMTDNYPYPHPFYAGQMLKPPHPVARLAYTLALWINPNNHALDGGRASSHMEKEAVDSIAQMFGYDAYLGHLTSGGTMANMEALWVAGELKPSGKVLASAQSHYTHSRISGVLKLPYQSVPVDNIGRMDVNALEDILKTQGDIAVVVVTPGTTAIGSVDPLVDILHLREKYGFRIHIDAAYGGYFTLADNMDAHSRAVYDHISEADSIVVDPHKHGLQPYGCGCVLFKDPSVGRFYKHDSPYTYFSSNELHLGEISLECSRAGASAVALWATQQLLPMERGGQFAQDLSACRAAGMGLYERLAADERFITPLVPELDIVIWTPKAATTSQMSELSQQFFDAAAERHLHLAVTKLPAQFFADVDGIEIDTEMVACVRSCLMKPEHNEWLDAIYEVIDATVEEIAITAG
ncbi:MAG: aminotransferase class I/II-fold pyridoxal phosphate-dependent enzyme [Chloroflexota bacterium]